MLVLDDSAFILKVLSEIVNNSAELTVVDTARNGQDALDKLAQHGPDAQLISLEPLLAN